MEWPYNKKVRHRHFEAGQLVLRHILPYKIEAKGKFSPNWQGPFMVKKVLPNGALYLTDVEGKIEGMPVNADAVKRYYEPPEERDVIFLFTIYFESRSPPEEQDEEKKKFKSLPEEQGKEKHTIMKSVNLSKLCMEENDSALKQVIHCNHGILLHLKTSWTSSNPGRRYWACPYYGGPRSYNFWSWRNSEDIDQRSKYMIPKLIEKLGELENVVESCPFNEVEKLITLSKSIKEGSEEVDQPKESKHDDNGINMKLEKLEEEIRKIKEKEKNWRRIAEGRTRDNTHFFVVFFVVY
ncbi:hypothetical protein FXO38_13525 [Capsicum annuum]|nr:hypothetical protein FXO38_13525 [Capsicum annuum]